MAQVEFEKGDVVVLKSGGPRMTINIASQEDVPEGMTLPANVSADRQAMCVWFRDEELTSLWFDKAMLDTA